MHSAPTRGSPVPRVLVVVEATIAVVFGFWAAFAIAVAIGVSFIGAIIVATGVLAIGGVGVRNRKLRRVAGNSAGGYGVFGNNLVNIETGTRFQRLLTRMTTGVAYFIDGTIDYVINSVVSFALRVYHRVNIFMLWLAGTFAFGSNTMLAGTNGMMMSSGTGFGRMTSPGIGSIPRTSSGTTSTTDPPRTTITADGINRGEATPGATDLSTPVPRTTGCRSPSCGCR